ncbi:outer membrane protein [Ferrovibrio xuzhouensis]|uniref:Outer membrane protein n=1 Tax=Ferrovibrio xuzhouensis TaxID=1576914 RepID=A0ABV7VFA1_9PROT
MRRYLIGLAVGWACIGNVQAQTAPSIDWSGLYAGGAVGATRSQADTAMSVAKADGYFTSTDPAQIAGAGDGTLKQWRPSGSLYGGYGRQYGHVVLGVEADAGTLLFDDDRATTVGYTSSPGNSFTIRQSVKADWLATVRPRLGWAEGNWLAYVTGGLAVARLSVDTSYTDTSFSGSSRSSQDKTQLGWSIGAGGEYALGDNWSLRGEYLFTDLGRITSTSPVSETFGGNPVLAHSAELQSHAIRIGLTYRFQGL